MSTGIKRVGRIRISGITPLPTNAAPRGPAGSIRLADGRPEPTPENARSPSEAAGDPPPHADTQKATTPPRDQTSNRAARFEGVSFWSHHGLAQPEADIRSLEAAEPGTGQAPVEEWRYLPSQP